jgi:hypothetical protein
MEVGQDPNWEQKWSHRKFRWAHRTLPPWVYLLKTRTNTDISDRQCTASGISTVVPHRHTTIQIVASSLWEGESVSRLQMGINLNMWCSNLEKNIYFSTYPPPTLIHLSQSVEIQSFDCCLSHFSISVPTSSSPERLPPSCDKLYATNTSHHKQETFLYEYPLHWVNLPTKTHNRTLLLCNILLMHCHHFDYWN